MAFATAASIVLQLAILAVLTWTPSPLKPPPPVEAVNVSIVSAPSPPPAPKPPARAKSKPKAAPKVPPVKAPPSPRVRAVPSPIAAAPPPPAPVQAEVSDAELAAATTAGSGTAAGSAGRPCNMIAWLQGELRKDASVRAAMSQAQHSGRATLVWNGQWLVSPGEEGEGLAVVRQAMMVHIAFAPASCRADPVRGLVLLALDDGPGAPKIALGRGAWAWKDLLGI